MRIGSHVSLPQGSCGNKPCLPPPDSLQNKAVVPDRLHGCQDSPGLQHQVMTRFLHRTGITVGELDKFNIIHVTGTKGKVDQRAFAERILRNSGFRTGFYSSPHLVHVRERICINGWPISRQLFTKYFWEAYEQLDDSKAAHGGSMPFYFQFLTMLAFHVFLHKLVDLAGIEVGIGGEYDCTNIIRKPWVCGVTSLDFDHCNLLSDTMEKIAWQKAGIFKPGVPAFTVSQQLGALKVLQDRAEGIGCPLSVCPELDHYEALVGPLSLGLVEDRKRFNASLALQLSNSWLQHTAQETGGLQQTEWLGRNQTLRRGSLTYYVDGAHTSASMKACVCWFRDQTNSPQHQFATRCLNAQKTRASG
ncbi:folylpolyglutamate synthase, mitochondrial-like [Sphaeramia orbicularis]|uniref:folylpolyglutamate synthase, mitochondrial-like n=1 Tax=Sphaeramia orbicularis TaxID=375764 RepID=UPI001180F4D8|nr:folylpolyglutamate synthase, mitochondrial-like [Sphaeramia orbicularis]